MIDVHIPKMGMSTVEVDVVGILVNVGDHVSVGDGLIEVETEKVTTVVEAEHDGTVAEILVELEETYEVGDVFLRLQADE